MPDKPKVRMCSWCQRINDTKNSKYSIGVDPEILKELELVDKQVKANKNNFEFTHGICVRHLIQTYKDIPGMTDEKN